MGESSAQIVEGPQPKPSRFQFVPVPGEFTRGRWKCRDSYHPYAETLEFEKNKTKEEANPDKISVSFKLRHNPEESTIQVTSIENNKDISDEMATTNSSESIIITRKNGVTILRKTSNTLLPEKYDQIRELSIDDFENKNDEKKQKVPPTPMNTPPASSINVDTNGTIDSSVSPHSSRKPSNEEYSDNLKPMNSSTTSLPTLLPPPTSFSTEIPPNSKISRTFQVEPVVLSEPSTPAPVAPAPSIETLAGPTTSPILTSLSEPTFQVIQTEESKNMSMDSVKNVIDAALAPPTSASLSNVAEVETPTNVQITVSAELEKKETAASGTADSVGIPIQGPTISAPHSTPYGTPKDSHQNPPAPSFEESTALPPIQTTSSTTTSGGVTTTTTSSSSAVTPAMAIGDSHTPIDNKIEQAMELVKTHLTYAVREEVDTLRNTIADLEYQMREYQYECNYYRQNCNAELIDQAGAVVRQQMSSHQRPTRRIATTTSAIFDGTQGTSVNSSSHMRNLQNQIQQMKQIAPTVPILPSSSSVVGPSSNVSAPFSGIGISIPSATAPPKPSPTTSESSLNAVSNLTSGGGPAN